MLVFFRLKVSLAAMLVCWILETEINDFKDIIQWHNINTNAPVYFQMFSVFESLGHMYVYTWIIAI